MILLKIFLKLPQISCFILFYTWEVLSSNLVVAIEVLRIKNKMAPGLVKVPITLTNDFAINLLANLITMTPGTMTIDVSEDKKFLYVYGLHIHDAEAFRSSITNTLEKQVKKLF